MRRNGTTKRHMGFSQADEGGICRIVVAPACWVDGVHMFSWGVSLRLHVANSPIVEHACSRQTAAWMECLPSLARST
jgi:hypothetical protein